MKTTLNHLPADKQQEILAITDIIKEVAKPEKILLFGSYATGEYVDSDRYVENNAVYEYQSDYDFLVVTAQKSGPEYVLKNKIKNRCREFRTPINPIIHDIDYINEGLSYGQYFFADIIKEGVLLYDTQVTEFAKQKELTSAEKRTVAQDYYDHWFQSASRFLDFAHFGYESALANNYKLNDTAFQLHQAAERFYAAILLVFTGYKPKTHNLEELRVLAKHLSTTLYQLFAFPPDNKGEEHLFELLIKAYVDARYKKDYVITSEETNDLIKRIEKMKEIVGRACTDHISSL
ncbi:HEPN domain-containing protein [Dawidia soli]|uniref:HEPN domain-containing protein n=1 Tax=Dawidia soli TaxID=2782352 RepID=A0AAP2GJH9_9BACT|nr:HEPN domain-containing protein [Dawidia soli]MBT1689421.1 HEPN domain-containing protein [Dawidia soli]